MSDKKVKSEVKQTKKIKVIAITDYTMPKGECMNLWGIRFESDGEQFSAHLDSQDADDMKDAGRVK